MTTTTNDTIANDLRNRGYMFYGDESQIDDIAAEWAAEFTADEAAEWMDAGFWDADAARSVRVLGINPGDVARLANDNVTGYDDAVYSICNGDLAADALIGDK